MRQNSQNVLSLLQAFKIIKYFKVSIMFKLVAFLLLVNIVSNIESAKILGIFPFPSISHQVVFRVLTNELLKRGHELTIITPDPEYPKDNTPTNLTEINVHDISYAAKLDYLSYGGVLGNHDVTRFTKMVCYLNMYIFEEQLKVPELHNFVFNSNKKFDLILVEAFFRPALVFSHIFKAPVILVSSLGLFLHMNNMFGVPSHPILYPSVFNKHIYNLTVWQRIKMSYDYFKIEYDDIKSQNSEHIKLQKYFGPDLPKIRELVNNVDMIFLYMNPLWAGNQPVPPNVIYIGNYDVKEKKDLPKDLKNYLDSSQHGVIYVSFGTNALARFIPSHITESIVRVLSNMPYDVLWKWDEPELPLKPKNIKISEWFPQSDLLRHKNVKLFITQAGLQSSNEAISAEVPLVAVPMLADQSYNADKYVYHGIGKNIPMEDFEEEIFKEAVESVISDKSYRQNIHKLRKLIEDEPQKPLERGMWWIDYVLRNGGSKHLRAPAANMSWMEYIQIDAIVTVAVILSIAFAILILVMMYCFKLIFGDVSKGDNKLKKTYFLFSLYANVN